MAGLDPAGGARRPRWALALALLVVGLLFPTSRDGIISVPLGVVHLLGLALLLALDWLGRSRSVSPIRLWNASAIVVVVAGATLVSPWPDLALGAIVPYVALAALLAADLREYRMADCARRAFVVLNVAAIGMALAIVVGAEPAREFLVRHYSTAYPDLVSNMTLWRKPVLTFGSHSVAAVGFYVMFLLNLESYRAGFGRGHLVLATSWVLVGVFLTSMTAGVLMAVAGAQLVLSPAGRRASGLLLLGGLVAGAVWTLARSGQAALLLDAVRLAFEVEGGGLRGRYAPGGALLGTLQQVMSEPLRPIGLSFSGTVFYGDSGPLEYLLRGSVLLLVAVYAGVGGFLVANLVARRHALQLLVVILFVEIGFTVLAFGRFLYLLAFAVLYLNAFGRGGYARPRSARAPST